MPAARRTDRGPQPLRRRTRSARPRPPRPPRHQRHQLRPPALGQPAGRPQAGRQEAHRQEPRRTARPPRPPPERVDHVVTFVPERCERCQEPLPPNPGPFDPEPTWHQVAELPPMAAEVTEYQGHFCTCPCCGAVNHAPVPAEVRAHSVGPRLAATLAYLA